MKTRYVGLAVALVLAGALLAGCDSPAVDKPTPTGAAGSDATPTPGATLQADPGEQASSPFAAVDPADYRSNYGDGVEFDSPSLNIQCGIFPDPEYNFFACSIDEYDYTDPTPIGDALLCSQNISYGHGFIASLDGEVEVLCRGGAGEWEIDPHPVLQYGSSITHGGVVCESTSDHMGCRSLDTGHGFTLSRNSYTMF